MFRHKVLITAAVVLAGCGDTPRETPQAAVPGGAAACPAAAAELRLGWEAERELPASIQAASLAALDSQHLALVGTDGRLSVLNGRGTPRAVASSIFVNTVVASGGRYLAAGDGRVISVDPVSGRIRAALRLDDQAGRIAGLAAGPDRLWISLVSDSAAGLLAGRWRGDRIIPMRRVALPGPVSIRGTADGRLAAALVRPPHSLLVYDSTLALIHRVTPPAPADTADAWFTLSVIDLGCGALLQVLTDLRSDRRRLLLYRMADERLEFLRMREFDQPIGFVHDVPGQPLLLGLLDGAPTRKAVLFRWSWKP